MLYEVGDAAGVLRFYRDFIQDAPEQLGGFPAWQIAPPLPFIPEDRHGDTFLLFVACWAGPIEEGEAALKPFHEVAPVVAEHVGPMPYPALNSAFDDLVPPGLQNYWKANFVKELTDEAIDAHLEYGPKVPVVNSTVHIDRTYGACHGLRPRLRGRDPRSARREGRRQGRIAPLSIPGSSRGYERALSSDTIKLSQLLRRCCYGIPRERHRA